MKYHKPEVLQIGAAISAIQALMSKVEIGNPDLDHIPTDDAYQSDE
jgi:hypothetical protein